MNPVPLTLVPGKPAEAKISAGWLASSDPLEWLRELSHARKHGCQLAAYPVATSLADPRALGVFLIPKNGSPAFRSRVMPLTEALPGLHVPQDACLSAALLPHERAHLFPYPLNFFHPSLGVVGFEAKDELPASRLLSPRLRPSASWSWAVAAKDAFPPLVSIVVLMPEDGPGQMLEEAGRDIGDKSGAFPPDETSLGQKLGTLGGGLIGGGLIGLGWFLSKLPGFGLFPLFRIPVPGKSGTRGNGKGSGRAPLADLLEWARKNWDQLQAKRDNEINRLMDLLEKNPDEGLRYALPLTGTEQSRGQAPPSWKLGQRNLDFRSGGGRAVDGWDLDANARLTLERKYREAAQREIALGRHERAAYIFGNLLGDWNSAAKALTAAERHHDAVSIYLHKLNNRPAAAKCLEDAGLLAQAAEIHVSIKQYEQAGDLHARLGQEGEARRLWLLATEHQTDPFEKARIFEEKLAQHDQALALLEKCWKANHHPKVALASMFRILRELDRRPEALDLLGRLFRESPASFSLFERISLAMDESERRPNESDFRFSMEGLVYTSMGEALVARDREATDLLSLLPRLDPGDRLLVRDAKRYTIPRARIAIPNQQREKATLRPIKVVKIPLQAHWQSVTPLKVGVSVAGHANGNIVAAQLRENGCHASPLMNSDVHGSISLVRHLGVSSNRNQSRLFHFPGTGTLHHRALDRARTPADDALGDLRNILAIGRFGVADEFILLERISTGLLGIHVYSESAVLRRTIPIDLAPPSVAGLTWFCAGRLGHLCFTAEGFFTWRHPDGRFETIAMDDHPAGLQLSPLGDLPTVLLPRRHEIVVIEPGKPGKPLEAVNLHSSPPDSSPPVACFTRDGYIVIGHEGGGQVFASSDYMSPVQNLLFPSDVGVPVDACSFGHNGFVFLTSNGHLLVFADA